MIITSLSPLLLLVSPLLPPLNITFPLFLSVNPQISHNLPKLNFLLLLVFLLSPFLLMLGSYLTVQSDSASVQSSHAARTEQSNAVASIPASNTAQPFHAEPTEQPHLSATSSEATPSTINPTSPVAQRIKPRQHPLNRMETVGSRRLSCGKEIPR